MKVIWSILLGSFVLFEAVNAADSPPLTSENQSNIKITSEQINCEQNQNTCTALGNAVAEKLNDPKKKILKADKITVHFTKKQGNEPTKIALLEAEGNVFFIIGDIIIKGKKGNYITESETAEVFEDVKITDDKNQLDGNYASVNMRTGHYSIKGDKNRVQALIFTKEK
ncbi:MAG: hypothetical protein FJX71_01270 [Alphaproteobacteria bacterium]|nr:hypothetical protein [Alphaproteobacteria bacterium]